MMIAWPSGRARANHRWAFPLDESLVLQDNCLRVGALSALVAEFGR
jgi:hypothetical protein